MQTLKQNSGVYDITSGGRPLGARVSSTQVDSFKKGIDFPTYHENSGALSRCALETKWKEPVQGCCRCEEEHAYKLEPRVDPVELSDDLRLILFGAGI
ncbi:MAG: hypothetical protein RL518_1094 [Pseudomonadota bacterium]